MKTSILTDLRRFTLLTAGLHLLASVAVVPARADTITQTVSQASANAVGWVAPIWGTPAAVPAGGNIYVVPAGLTLRTPNNSTPAAFPGDLLVITNGGTLALKHSGGAASNNLVLGPGTINNFGGVGSTGVPPSPLAGTINVVANANITATGTTTPQPRHIELRSTLSGTGNFTVNVWTNALYLSGNASAYSGNWNVTGGRVEVWTGTANPFGSGTVTLNDATNTLTFNSGTDMGVANTIAGFGGVIKAGSNTVTLTGANTFFGGLTVRDGTLVLPGTSYGNQSATVVTSNGVLRVASGTQLGLAPLTVDGNNAMTARLELSNNVTVQTFQGIAVSMRNNSSPAIVSVSGNNVIADTVNVQAGGTQLYVQVEPGSSLDLSGGVSSIATGGRNFTLQGAGNGTVSGPIANGTATTLALYKAGTGTWTLNAINSYTGNTVVSNGVLRLGASGSIGSSPVIQVEAGGILDGAAAGGLALGGLGTPQILRGQGAVLGDVSTSAGSSLEVALANQTGSLNLSNNLVLGGGDTLRFDVASSSNDVLNVAGNLVLNGTSTNQINLIGGFVDNGTYRLINYGGTLQGFGSFTLLNPASRQSFSLDLSTPHQVNLVVTGNPTNLVWSGDSVFNAWDVGMTPNWNSQTEVFYNADYVTFNDTGSATPDIDVTVPLQVSSMVISNEARNFTFIDTNGISSTGSLIKQGGGLAVLANPGNAFNGPITIAAGTLQIGNGITNGSLGNGPIALAAAGTLAHDKTNNLGTTLGGLISGEGSIRVRSGSLQLAGTNTFTGPVTVESGDLSLRNNSSLGDPVGGTTVMPGGSVRVSSLGNWVIPEPLTLSGSGYTNAWLNFPGALYINTVSNRVVWTGPITLAGETMIRAVNDYLQLTLSNHVTAVQQPITFAAEGTGNRIVAAGSVSIGNAVLMTKTGTGTLVLAGATNLAGGTVVNAGTVAIATTNSPDIGDITVNAGTLAIGDGGAAASFPLGLINLVNTGSRLALNTTTDLTLTKEVFGAGSLAKQNSNTVTITLSNSFAGNVTTGSGAPSPNGTGAGVIRLLNSYGLGNELNPKTVQLIRAELQLQGGVTIPSTISFETSGGRYVVPPGQGPGLIPIRSVSGNNVIEGNLRLIGGAGGTEYAVDSGTLTINGQITDQATSVRNLYLSGAGTAIVNGSINNGAFGISLQKQGSGVWNLNSQNYYTGVTIIEGGTLALGAAASLAGTPTIELKSNAVFNVAAVSGGFTLDFSQTLKGNGSVVGGVTANGTVSPGASVGALYFSNSLALAGTTIMELSRTNTPLNADLLSAAGIAFGGTLMITNIGPELQGGEVFNLFDGALSGAFVSVTLPTLANPLLSWNTNDLATLGVIRVDGGQAPPFALHPPTLSGTNLVIQFSSQTGYKYYLEHTPALVPANWSILSTNDGGGVITLQVPVNPANPQEFFRVRGGQ